MRRRGAREREDASRARARRCRRATGSRGRTRWRAKRGSLNVPSDRSASVSSSPTPSSRHVAITMPLPRGFTLSAVNPGTAARRFVPSSSHASPCSSTMECSTALRLAPSSARIGFSSTCTGRRMGAGDRHVEAAINAPRGEENSGTARSSRGADRGHVARRSSFAGTFQPACGRDGSIGSWMTPFAVLEVEHLLDAVRPRSARFERSRTTFGAPMGPRNLDLVTQRHGFTVAHRERKREPVLSAGVEQHSSDGSRLESPSGSGSP